MLPDTVVKSSRDSSLSPAVVICYLGVDRNLGGLFGKLSCFNSQLVVTFVCRSNPYLTRH
jgi:hypothetical protein